MAEFNNVSAATIGRSIDRWNAGGRFTGGANFLTHTKWDNFKTFFSSLFSAIGLTKDRRVVELAKTDELDSAAKNFAIDILKSNIDVETPHPITLKDDSGVDLNNPKEIYFNETLRGELHIYDRNGIGVSKPMKFIDLQVLALKEILDQAEQSGTSIRINTSAIPNFDTIRDKFHDKFGTNAALNLESRCENDIHNLDDILVESTPRAMTEADVAWHQAQNT
jgi:hypothetical protein